MDGVLTEVSESYREAIVQTVFHFTGQQITRDLIQQYKNQGGWNNDWALTQKIAADLGVSVEYGDVVTQFNARFLGQNGDGLIQKERWFPRPGLLERLCRQYELAIFTGRLRYDPTFDSIRLSVPTAWRTESPRLTGCIRSRG
jgi:HAD superfamily phosphatase